MRRWVPKALQNKPIYVFETGGTTGIPKSRVVVEDHRIDYEMFSDTLPDKYFPKGSNWLMLGPSGPRRLRLAVEHLCQHRGGICFCVDLDPRWVVKLIKKGWMEHLKAYQEHVIDQAMTILSANHDIKCMFTTPKLLDALCGRLEKDGSSIAKTGITGIFCGGTEMTSQWIRFAIEELLGPDVYIAPTYGNTLMGLAAAEMPTAADNYKIAYYAPQPRAVVAGRRLRRLRQGGRLRPGRPRHADDADQGVLRAALPGARRGRARAAVARSIPGTASAASSRSAASRRRRRSGCTETRSEEASPMPSPFPGMDPYLGSRRPLGGLSRHVLDGHCAAQLNADFCQRRYVASR